MQSSRDAQFCVVSYNINGVTRFEDRLPLQAFFEARERSAGCEAALVLCLQELKLQRFEGRSFNSKAFCCNSVTGLLGGYAGVSTVTRGVGSQCALPRLDYVALARAALPAYERKYVQPGTLPPVSAELFEKMCSLMINEGRVAVSSVASAFALVNVYVPARRNNERLSERRLVFLFLVLLLETLLNALCAPVVLVGDFNAIYQARDSNSDHTTNELMQFVVQNFSFADPFERQNLLTFKQGFAGGAAAPLGHRLDYILLASPSHKQFDVLRVWHDEFDQLSDHTCIGCRFRTHAAAQPLDAAIRALLQSLAPRSSGTRRYVNTHLDRFVTPRAAGSSEPLRSPATSPRSKRTATTHSDVQCPAHGTLCVVKRVRRNTPNKGRFFASCPQAACSFFRWL